MNENGNGRGARGIISRIVRQSRLYWLKVLRIKAEPEVIARGVACGVFAGWLPVVPGVPFQIAVALILSFILKGSKIAAFLATWVSNPFNWVVFYYVTYKVGSFLSPFEHMSIRIESFDIEAIKQLANVGWKGLVVMIIGGTIMGIPSGIATYFISLRFIRGYRKRRALRQMRKTTSL